MLAGLEELSEREFLGLLSHVVRVTRGVEVELMGADIVVDGREFRRKRIEELAQELAC